MENTKYDIPPEKMKPLPPKPAVKSKTVQGAMGEAAGLVLASIGIAESPAFIFDGWQPQEDMTAAVGFGIAVAGYVWRQYGKRAAQQAVSGFFKTKGK